MQEAKRGPGRPRKSERRIHIDITLSLEIVEYLDRQSVSRSQFIELVLRAQMESQQRQDEYFASLKNKR